MSPGQAVEQGREWLVAQVGRIERHLTAEFGERVPASRIADSVRQAHARFAQAPVRPFLPTLVERDARRRIRAHDDRPVRDLAS